MNAIKKLALISFFGFFLFNNFQFNSFVYAAVCGERNNCAVLVCPPECPSVKYGGPPESCICAPIAEGQIKNPVLNPVVGAGEGETILAKIVAAIINLFFIAGSFAVLIYFLLGGLAWITSEGDKSKLETAKTRLTAALTGIIIIAATYAVLKLIGGALGIDFFKDLIVKWPTITQ